MSRSQESSTYDTASDQNKGYYDNSKNSYTQAQGDINDYQDQLSKYAASNPYVQGGEFQKTTNQQLTNTADAGAQAAGQSLQAQQLREGGNTSGAVAATEAMQQQNTRDLSSAEAAANQNRIGQEAGYNKSVLQASEVPEQMEQALYGTSAGAANNALGTQQKAAETPSWMDEFGGAFANGLGSMLTGGKR